MLFILFIGMVFAICTTSHAGLAVEWSGVSISGGVVIETPPPGPVWIDTFFMSPATLAYDFTVGPSDLLITSLGYVDWEEDGLMFDHDLTIWNPDGTTVASTTIPQGTVAQLIDRTRYMSLGQPARLNAGQTYMIGSWHPGGLDDCPRSTSSWDPTTFPNFVSFGANTGFVNSDTIEFPTEYSPGSPSIGPLFQYQVVPEPSTWALMLCGVGALLVQQHRRTRRANGTA